MSICPQAFQPNGIIMRDGIRPNLISQYRTKYKARAIRRSVCWRLGAYDLRTLQTIMNKMKLEHIDSTDNSRKSILARGCDPQASLWAAKSLPPLLGNPEYVATTEDADFVDKLKSRKWSVIYFAPGACRFSAAKESIPGGNFQTQGWTLEQYRELVSKHQGDAIKIVETLDERQTVRLLKSTLRGARMTG